MPRPSPTITPKVARTMPRRQLPAGSVLLSAFVPSRLPSPPPTRSGALLLAGNSTVNGEPRGDTGDSAGGGPLPANGGIRSACGEAAESQRTFSNGNFDEKWIALANSGHCHYGMAHGFHRVGLKRF